MAKKQKYPTIYTPRGVLIYPRLTEPDTKFVKPDGEYHTKFAIEADRAEEMVESIETFLEKYIDKKLPEIEERAEGLKGQKLKKVKKVIAKAQERECNELFEEEVDDEGEETGRIVFKFKLKAKVKTEKKSWDQQPRLFDAGDPDNDIKPKDITDTDINPWTGTEGKCKLELFPYFMEKDGVFGVSLRLRGVQILELVEGGGAGDGGFDSEGGFQSDTSTSKKRSSNDDDDEGDDDEDDEDEF